MVVVVEKEGVNVAAEKVTFWDEVKAVEISWDEVRAVVISWDLEV
jgi:hypothetical protein